VALLVTDPLFEESLRAEREASGADRYDEVWDGVYVVSPNPNIDHQEIVANLTGVFLQLLGWNRREKVFAGVNVSDRTDDWKQNYRVPDVAVFLENTRASNRDTYWLGGPDFLIEVESAHDKSREKLPFYASVGVREVLIVERQPWALSLYRLDGSEMALVARVTPDDALATESTVLPVKFRLIDAQPRPWIEVSRLDGSEQWLV
jgi:Uma2 family endonuclease